MVFKPLLFLKIVDLSLMAKVPTEMIVELEKIPQRFMWLTKLKIKIETISSDFKDGVPKNVDISKKISIECSCIKRLHGGLFYKWKLIPLKLIKKSFGDELKFHSNVSFNNSMSDIFHAFTKIFD